MNNDKEIIIDDGLKRNQGELDSYEALKIIKSDVTKLDSDFQWFNVAKFGMFIHWGLYSVAGGKYNNKENTGLGEWLPCELKVDLDEYTKVLSKEFTGEGFNADNYIHIAKNAGMKYIVIVTKHHEGFCLFDTKETDNNSVENSPSGRDFVKELADACHRENMLFGIYYSVADWYNEYFPADLHVGYHRFPNNKGDTIKYGRFMKNQLRELLTNYGKINFVWFDQDQPYLKAEPEICLDIDNMMYQLQPHIVTNRKWGPKCKCFGAGEQVFLSNDTDNSKKLSETCITMNDTFGYKCNDDNWKSVDILIQSLCRAAGSSSNLLLNIGPKGNGEIPKESLIRLKQMGIWLNNNEESIYGVKGSPFLNNPWGTTTVKNDIIYFHLFDFTNNKFIVHGLTNKVCCVYIIEDNKKRYLDYTQNYDEELDLYSLEIILIDGIRDNKNVKVIGVKYDGCLRVDNMLVQQPNGSMVLPATLCEIHNENSYHKASLGYVGQINDFVDCNTWLSYKVKIINEGVYDINVLSMASRNGDWLGGHELSIIIGDTIIDTTVIEHERIQNKKAFYYKTVVSNAGKIKVDKKGIYSILIKPKKLLAKKIDNEEDLTFTFMGLNLEPCN
ncbi:hypothetical protein SH1V18_24500 [Vallitalea longa]|uniref:alpha-L-fucosidase n=1 Tax=Vallitalea longa TaxID=2936439 RepID=A0A9W6DEX3_9FIRM|nr:alpha-L-fucosidase [Vallitalea longa]GKX29970.1 hypothetical protein SH1V18_24500 [Vallitalea longa]